MIFSLALIGFAAAFTFLAWRNLYLALVLLFTFLPAFRIRFEVPLPFGLSVPSTVLELMILAVVIVWLIKRRASFLKRETSDVILRPETATWSRGEESRGGNSHSERSEESRGKFTGSFVARLLRMTSDRVISFPPAAYRFRFPIILFLFAATLTLIYTPQPAAALGLWRAYFFEPIFLFLVLIDVVRSRREIHGIIAGVAVSVLVLSLIGIYQQFTGWLLPYPWNEPELRRVTSFFAYPNAFALYLAPFLILLAGKWGQSPFFKIVPSTILGQRKLYLVLFPIALVLGTIALIFTKSASGLAAFAAAIIFLLIVHPQRRRLLSAAIVAAVVVGLYISLQPALRQKAVAALTFQENSAQVRLALWQGTARLLADNPLLGAGLAGFPVLYDQYRLARHTELLLYPHNIILNFWVEIGLLGLIAFIWLIYEFFRLVWKQKQALLYGPAAAIVAILIHGMVDVPYFKNDLAVQFWLIVGLAVAAADLPREK